MGRSLADLTAEIRGVNVAHGWRPAEGGPGENTFGDYIALLHSEVSEALEAYRDHRLKDATEDHHNRMHGLCVHGEPRGNCNTAALSKPEGVGSELADVLIRLLDMCDVFGIVPFDMDCELADVAPLETPSYVASFGDHVTWLHWRIAQVIPDPSSVVVDGYMAFILRSLVAVAERHGIDLTAEVERKIAYNRTRPFRHGGRHL